MNAMQPLRGQRPAEGLFATRIMRDLRKGWVLICVWRTRSFPVPEGCKEVLRYVFILYIAG
jgi:hypothetical protein